MRTGSKHKAGRVPARRGAPPRPAVVTRMRPSQLEIAAAHLLLQPWQWLTAPKFFGLEHVSRERPALLVGNHTLFGVLDVPLLALALYEQRGVFVRPLGDHLHFRVPAWRDLLQRFGTVDGTPENCHALMRAGESVLVFPGGGREVFKHKGERYQLLWRTHMGFARLAIAHHYPIIPFAAVGAEECYDILADGDELRRTPLGPLIERLAPRPDLLPPLVHGLGPTWLPRPERFYFSFAPAIDTAQLEGREDDDATCFRLRERVRKAVEREIAFLLTERKRDPERAFGVRVLDQLRGLTRAPGNQPVARRRRAGRTKTRRKSP
jgi:1-acyl-sn-glycerol-3-phosphate acyltransferase